MNLLRRADKQQEDLDLPYLTTTTSDGSTNYSEQSKAQQHETGAGNKLETCQSAVSICKTSGGAVAQGANLASSPLNDDRGSQVTSGAATSQLVGPAEKVVDTKRLQEINLESDSADREASQPESQRISIGQKCETNVKQTSAPSLVIKSASSSSVLSSVSLASGAQMKPHANSSLMPVPARASEFVGHSDESLKEESRTDAEGERQILVSEDRDNEIHSSDGKDLDKLDAHKEKPLDDDEQVLEPLPGRDPQIQTPKPRIKQLKQLLRHTNSLNQLPEFGMDECKHRRVASLFYRLHCASTLGDLGRSSASRCSADIGKS